MIKLRKIEDNNWNITEHRSKNGNEPIMLVTIIDTSIRNDPITTSCFYTGPYDNTIDSSTHDCLLIYDDEPSYGKYVESYIVFFRNKHLDHVGDIINTSITPKSIEIINDSAAPAKSKTIRSNDNKTTLTVHDKGVTMKSGDNFISVSPKGIVQQGKHITMDDNNYGAFLKEKNIIMRMLPNAFVPPFCMPDVMPDFEIVGNLSKFIGIIKDMHKILSGGK